MRIRKVGVEGGGRRCAATFRKGRKDGRTKWGKVGGSRNGKMWEELIFQVFKVIARSGISDNVAFSKIEDGVVCPPFALCVYYGPWTTKPARSLKVKHLTRWFDSFGQERRLGNWFDSSDRSGLSTNRCAAIPVWREIDPAFDAGIQREVRERRELCAGEEGSMYIQRSERPRRKGRGLMDVDEFRHRRREERKEREEKEGGEGLGLGRGGECGLWGGFEMGRKGGTGLMKGEERSGADQS
ncbi:hypothetical protein C8R43DRAFT_959575 [Mycena crocata]|nr:hypothetical protein C8R43DRAFT_959575 [Mycena crocata]